MRRLIASARRRSARRLHGGARTTTGLAWRCPVLPLRGAEAAGTANTEWWKQFQDPVLDGLIAEALANNKNVKIAAANVEQAAGVLPRPARPSSRRSTTAASARAPAVVRVDATRSRAGVPTRRRLSRSSPGRAGRSISGAASAGSPRRRGPTARHRGGAAGRDPLSGGLGGERLYPAARPRRAARDRQAHAADLRRVGEALRAAVQVRPGLPDDRGAGAVPSTKPPRPPSRRSRPRSRRRRTASRSFSAATPGLSRAGRPILELAMPAGPGGSAVAGAGAPSGHPAGRAEPRSPRTPRSARPRRSTSRPSRSPAATAGERRAVRPLQGAGTDLELRRVDHRADLRRRGDLRPGQAGRGGAEGGASQLRGGHPERLRRRGERAGRPRRSWTEQLQAQERLVTALPGVRPPGAAAVRRRRTPYLTVLQAEQQLFPGRAQPCPDARLALRLYGQHLQGHGGRVGCRGGKAGTVGPLQRASAAAPTQG